MGEWLDLLGTTGDVVGQDGGDVDDGLMEGLGVIVTRCLWVADEAAMLNVPLLAIDIMYLAIAQCKRYLVIGMEIEEGVGDEIVKRGGWEMALDNFSLPLNGALKADKIGVD